MKKLPYPFDKIGENLREIRKLKKIGQYEISVKVGLSRASIIHIESGMQSLTIENLYKFCIAFDCEITDLLPSVSAYKEKIFDSDMLLQEIFKKYPDKKAELMAILS